MVPFRRLIRFKDNEGNIHYGEAPEGFCAAEFIGQDIDTYDDPFSTIEISARSQKRKRVAEILSPIPNAAHIYGIGLNYKGHAAEAGLLIPDYPLVFSKPVDALAGPFDDIPIHKECTFIDYEGELAVVIGKDCKNIGPSENPLDYVLGYCASNDVSSRYWQMAERGGQPGYAKGFDKFAPIGPVLVSPEVITDVGPLRMVTTVNGEERQSTELNDLIFDVPTLIRHLSRGTTLRKFTVILTGTPSGVAALMKPPAYLKDGDIVEIVIEKIGKIRNRITFVV